jgi:FkbM family methyltransferase
VNPFSAILGALRAVAQHPINRRRKLKAVAEYGFIQIASRLVPGEVCVPFPNGTRLLIPPRMKGAAHYIAPRLCEFDEMALVAHLLRKGDLFVDVGANIGAFSVLAAGVAQANVLAFEPSPGTFDSLTTNIRLNGFQDSVRLVQAAVGRTAGFVSLTRGRGTENFVPSASQGTDCDKVALTTLDTELGERPVSLLKVDVEGYETEVFAGAKQTLSSKQLQAIIVERNDAGVRYGFDEDALHQGIRELGFVSCSYDPLNRNLSPIGIQARGNIIYVRDLARARALVKAAPPFHLGDLHV